jgi:hypothetical protein
VFANEEKSIYGLMGLRVQAEDIVIPGGLRFTRPSLAAAPAGFFRPVCQTRLGQRVRLCRLNTDPIRQSFPYFGKNRRPLSEFALAE